MSLRIGLTLGDPCGIGPELWVRILCSRLAAPAGPHASLKGVRLRLFGDGGVLERAAARLSLSTEWAACLGFVELVPVTELSIDDSRPGRPSMAGGAAQVRYLQAALDGAAAGELQGLCTAPIHKASAREGGLGFPGHTELLAAWLGRPDERAVMMLCGPSLRVSLATIHIPLGAVPGCLSSEGVCEVICTTARALRHDFGITAPRLWVAGLNPHAGEGGHFGDEESRIIAPAMAAAAQRLHAWPTLSAVKLAGPLVPDALFRAAVHGPRDERPDAVVAMYHDQGLIPLKLLDFDQAVNVTLGLRVPRTSPDHGVAHDIAADYVARPHSQAAALDLCIELARRRAAGSA